MEVELKFRPIYSCWVAVHPQPKGIIQFIGGAFFGSFPTFSYRYLLEQLFKAGYTLIVFPFKFTFRHWKVAVDLVKERNRVCEVLLRETLRTSYASQIYDTKTQAKSGNYFWLGHSLGCKYIALLEILSDLEVKTEQEVLQDCIGKDQYQQIEESLNDISLEDASIRNQPSILMAPDISNTRSAIRLAWLANLIDDLNLGVVPTVKQAHCLIKKSRLFNLTAVLAFNSDRIALNTINWLRQHLKQAQFEYLPGQHLTPLGIWHGDSKLSEEILQLIPSFQNRLTPSKVSQ